MHPLLLPTMFFISAANVALGAFVFRSASSKYTASSFFALTVSIAWWSICLGLADSALSAPNALFWTRMIMVGTIPIPFFIQHFVNSFAVKGSPRFVWNLLHGIVIIILEKTVWTSLMFPGAEVQSWGVHFYVGPAYV